jgi:O-methyltransferase domain/Dimerisation domain
MNTALTPDHILQTGMAFWASKTLLTAVELALFTELARSPLTADAVQEKFGLHPRGVRDFLDALVAMKFLTRTGGVYANTPETSTFLDRAKPSYCGGILEMCSTRLYSCWNRLPDALRSGQPQNGSDGTDPFIELYDSPEKLESFLGAMTGISLGAAHAIAQKFPWQDHRTFADIGCAQGAVPVTLATLHPHLRGTGWDLPAVQPVFEKYAAARGVADRVQFKAGDFFRDPLPQADVLIMGHILHDWDLEQKKMLLAKAHAALPEGGALIVYEALMDDDRSSNAFGLLMSLNMLIETPGGFDFTGADCRQWMREAGFRETRVEHLVGPDSMVIAIK